MFKERERGGEGGVGEGGGVSEKRNYAQKDDVTFQSVLPEGGETTAQTTAVTVLMAVSATPSPVAASTVKRVTTLHCAERVSNTCWCCGNNDNDDNNGDSDIGGGGGGDDDDDLLKRTIMQKVCTRHLHIFGNKVHRAYL